MNCATCQKPLFESEHTPEGSFGSLCNRCWLDANPLPELPEGAIDTRSAPMSPEMIAMLLDPSVVKKELPARASLEWYNLPGTKP